MYKEKQLFMLFIHLQYDIAVYSTVYFVPIDTRSDNRCIPYGGRCRGAGVGRPSNAGDISSDCDSNDCVDRPLAFP